MREDVFEKILRCVELPLGELLSDGTTYRVSADDFARIRTKHLDELQNFEKFLVLTANRELVVGGVLFYGSADIQEIVFPEYRGQHFMSAIHKNGVLKAECYPRQQVTLEINAIKSFYDFLMKRYLASCIGLTVSNLAEIHKYFNYFKVCEKYSGFQEVTKEEFIERYS